MTIYLQNSAIYIGASLDHLRSGHGIQTWKDHSVYEGFWLNGRPNGHGQFIYPNGDVYEGNWSNGKASGEGKLIQANDTVYFFRIQLLGILVLGKTTSKVALVKRFGRMGWFLEASTKMDAKKARALWSIQTSVNIVATGKITRCMAMAHIPGQTAESLRVSGWKTRCMAKVIF